MTHHLSGPRYVTCLECGGRTPNFNLLCDTCAHLGYQDDLLRPVEQPLERENPLEASQGAESFSTRLNRVLGLLNAKQED